MNRIHLFAATLAVAAILLATPPAVAQTPVTQSDTVSQTATITAIDYTQRVVSLKFTDGTAKTIEAGPEVTRFGQLKVGDTVTFTASQSVVYSIAKPGAPVPDTSTVSRAPGSKPGGTATRTKTAIVTITAIDPAVPSVTVKTDDGQIAAFKVDDPKNIAGFKPGDKVQITYSVSLMISVK